MPPIKRWFPVSHDINGDPEVWAMCDKYGERILRVWLQMISVADRNEGVLKGTLKAWAETLLWLYSKGNPKWLNRDLERLQNALRDMTDKGWIRLRSLSESDQRAFRDASEGSQRAIREGSEDSLEVVNYAKYHRTREPIRRPPNLPNLPNLNKTPIVPKNGDGVLVGFEEFWIAYPKKVAKKAAVKAWAKELGTNTDILPQLMAALARAAQHPGWQKDNGAFIPHPATWINGRRWEDSEQVKPIALKIAIPKPPPILTEPRPPEAEKVRGLLADLVSQFDTREKA